MVEKSAAAKSASTESETAKADAAKTDAGLDMDAMRAELEHLRGELSRLLDAVGESARQAADDVAIAAEAQAETAGIWAEGQCESLRSSIRERPLTACAIAAGAGLILGQILLRR